jgi:hypothetical protein
MTGIQGDEVPTDPETIKEHIKVRRQAVRIMLAEITVLSERLRKTVGPVEWLKYMSAESEAAGADIFGVAKERAQQ